MRRLAAALLPMAAMAAGGRAVEHESGILAGRSEGLVLGEEAIAGMDGLGARLVRGLKDAVDAE